MPRQASPRRLAKFRRDVEKLKEKYTSEEIAKKWGIKPTNFSSYCTGEKNPGADNLDKFYSIFGEELNGYGDQTDRQEEFQETDEPEAVIKYIPKDDRDDHLHTLKLDVAHFRYANRELTDTNRELVRSVKKAIHNNSMLTQATHYLVFKNSPRRFKKKPPKSE